MQTNVMHAWVEIGAAVGKFGFWRPIILLPTGTGIIDIEKNHRSVPAANILE